MFAVIVCPFKFKEEWKINRLRVGKMLRRKKKVREKFHIQILEDFSCQRDNMEILRTESLFLTLESINRPYILMRTVLSTK